jgi:DNA-binding CsgD family transcriptional regulator
MRPSDFAAHAFEWLRGRIWFDQAIIVTSLRSDPTWFDAHFWGVADPRALMESHARVRHLDVLSKRMLSSVLQAHRIDVADPTISGPRFAPFREHLLRFGGIHVLGIAVPIGEGAVSSVFMLVRGKIDHRFTAKELELLEVVTPHFAEAAAVNRLRWLLFDNGPPNADTFPVALLGPDGRFTQMTPGFAQLFWPEAPPVSAYLPESSFAELRKGRASRLPDGKHSLHGQADNSGGWLLRIRASGPLDRLTPRERQVAGLFARGVSHKGIAEELAPLTPATVRNHLRHIYEKLEVRSRDELVALLARP